MNRHDFLKACAGGLCTCAVARALGSTASSTTEKPPQEDWRSPFVQSRYGTLLEILSAELGEMKLSDTLRQLGRSCASPFGLVKKHKGHLDEFLEEFQKVTGETATYDRANGIITIASPERDACYCPLVNSRTTPKIVCNCSLGWQQHVYENVIGQRVEVTLKESVVRGGKRCIFEIRIKPEPATATVQPPETRA